MQVNHLIFNYRVLGVGKSTIIDRFIKGDLKDSLELDPTLGAAFMSKVFVYNGNEIKYQVLSIISLSF